MKKIFLIALLAGSTVAATAQNWNGGLNTWRSFSSGIFPATQLEAPDKWYSADSLLFSFSLVLGNVEKQLFKETAAHTGAYAAKLVTRDHGGQLGIIPAVFSNAKINVDIASFDPNDPLSSVTYEGGTPVSQRIQSVNAWIKYLPVGGDNGSITVQAVLAGQGSGGTDSVVGLGNLVIAQAYNNFTYVEVPVVYTDPNVVPDKLLVLCTSSTSAAEDNTTLVVDDIWASLFTAGIELPLMKEHAVVCYPNPGNGIVSLRTDMKDELQWTAYDIKGKEVSRHNFTATATIDMSALPTGVYVYTINNRAGDIVQEGRISISK